MNVAHFWRIRQNYGHALKRLRKRSEKGEKIRVGYSVIFESAFPMAPVFEEMLKNDFFEPFLIVIPDISRSEKHAIETYSQAKVKLTADYGDKVEIINAIDWKKKELVEVTDKCDLYCPANPYDCLTHQFYGVRNFCNHNIPVFFANYGIAISSFYDRYMSDPGAFGYFWKVFSETKYVNDLLKNNIPWVDSVYTGYPKMDKLATFMPKERERKRIIIAPHHTINEWQNGVNFGNFLHYKNFFMELPVIYPEIDFVFRPHPLLFTALARDDNMGEDKAQQYLSQMRSHANVEVQIGGDYLETFVNSDALIHDCGSFTAEYLFVDKPACRLLRSDNDLKTQYNQFALDCINCHELAYTEKDILNFINTVVLNDNDMKSDVRHIMSLRLKKNFPNVSKNIVKNIKASVENA